MEKYPPYQAIFSKLSYGESQMLDKAFYEEEVKRLCLAFEQQVGTAVTMNPCLFHFLGHTYPQFSIQSLYIFAFPLTCSSITVFSSHT